jgi:hypothetical protein
VALGLKVIREAVETRLANVTNGVRGRPTNIYAHPPRFPPPPWIGVKPGVGGEYVAYFETFGRGGKATVLLTIEVGIVASEISQQIAMDDYLSVGSGFTSSIVDALLADVTLGGAVDTIKIGNATEPQWEDSDRDVLIARIPLEIVATKVSP